MKIYIASSWKNFVYLIGFADLLMEQHHEVDLFCGKSINRFVFKPDTNAFSNADDYINHPLTQRIFYENRNWINWSDTVIMVLPCGKSSHLEAGYAKGLGKKLIIFGDMTEGDAMYLFADIIFGKNQLDDLLAYLKKSGGEEMTKTKKPLIRTSANGFYCAHCNKFAHKGYDSQDKKNLPHESAICIECGDFYEDVTTDR